MIFPTDSQRVFADNDYPFSVDDNMILLVTNLDNKLN